MPMLFNFPKKKTVDERKRRRTLTLKAVCLWGCGLAALACFSAARAYGQDVQHGTQRKLLQWNPMQTDMDEMGPLDEAGAPIWLLLLIWLFAGVAIVTDGFFTPALEGISTSMGLSEDVAGATFLAAASSAPEFFTSLADTFASSGSGMGIGTIVGSAVFNILVIVAVSCIPCDKLNLDWYPLMRDSFFYVVAIIMLLVFVLTGEENVVKDTDANVTLLLLNGTQPETETVGVVEWWESMLLVLGYVGYIIYMVFSGRIRPKAVRCKDRTFKTNESGEYPDYDTHKDFACQVVQQVDDEGELVMLSTRAGDAGRPHTFSEPFAADSARPNPITPKREEPTSPPRRRSHHHHHHQHGEPHVPPAVMPTPRRRRQWEREKQKWESTHEKAPESAFTRWVISQRKAQNAGSESGEGSMSSPRSASYAYDTARDVSKDDITKDDLPTKDEESPGSKSGHLSRTDTLPIIIQNDPEGPPPPVNSPSSEPASRCTTEMLQRIQELTKEKEEAKARDDLELAAKLKSEIDELQKKSFNVASDSSSSSSSSSESEGEWEEGTVTIVKSEFLVVRGSAELGFEVDEGDDDDDDAKPAVVKVCRSRKRAKEHGFKEEMEILRVNDMKVHSLHDIEEALQRSGMEDEVIFQTRIEVEPDFWDPEWPEDGSCFWTFVWALVLPLVFMFKATIPRADRRKTRKCYWMGFIMSIFWIGILSMYMLKFASWLGAICRIDPTVMGIVVLAAGTSVPDAMASYCAAKMGMADMAVSNALGSNVFNIFAGLGVPWLLSSAIKGEPIHVPKDGIVIPTLILFLILGIFLWTLKSYNFQLNPSVGKIFMSLMGVYWTWTLLNEFVIGLKI
eukprot:Hpha_TRINITY_DN15917_c5_g2::TRINITY_DN15917_c5_g2_i1::g.74838::m.74838